MRGAHRSDVFLANVCPLNEGAVVGEVQKQVSPPELGVPSEKCPAILGERERV